jgi:hypothetical protein
MQRTTLWIALIVSILVSDNTRAQTEPGDRSVLRVARLIRDLGAESFDRRREAHEVLRSLGSLPREQLEQALEETNDPEVRLQARQLLEQLRIDELWEPAFFNASTAETEDASTASARLAELAQQSGNRLLVGDQYGPFKDGPVTIDASRIPFWKAVDQLCQQSGNHVRPHYDTRNPGLVVVSGAPGDYPVAYSGPLRAKLSGAKRVFIEELDYEALESDVTHTFQLNLQIMWEDRFRLVGYRSQPTLVEAITDTGEQLSSTDQASSGWNVASPGALQVSMILRMRPPTTEAQSLKTLKLHWDLVAVGDMRVFEIDDLAEKTRHVRGDLELGIESISKRQNARYDLTAVVNRLRVVPDPPEVLFHENEFELLDADDRPFLRQGQTNNLTDEGAKMKLSFVGQSSDSEPKKLRFHYPRIRSQRTLEIVFEDVPLPVGKPD